MEGITANRILFVAIVTFAIFGIITLITNILNYLATAVLIQIYNKQQEELHNQERYIELEPCPFCGQHKADVYQDVLEGSENEALGYGVFCDPSEGGCGAATKLYGTAEEALTAWNIRDGRIINYWKVGNGDGR